MSQQRNSSAVERNSDANVKRKAAVSSYDPEKKRYKTNDRVAGTPVATKGKRLSFRAYKSSNSRRRDDEEPTSLVDEQQVDWKSKWLSTLGALKAKELEHKDAICCARKRERFLEAQLQLASETVRSVVVLKSQLTEKETNINDFETKLAATTLDLKTQKKCNSTFESRLQSEKNRAETAESQLIIAPNKGDAQKQRNKALKTKLTNATDAAAAKEKMNNALETYVTKAEKGIDDQTKRNKALILRIQDQKQQTESRVIKAKDALALEVKRNDTLVTSLTKSRNDVFTQKKRYNTLDTRFQEQKQRAETAESRLPNLKDAFVGQEKTNNTLVWKRA